MTMTTRIDCSCRTPEPCPIHERDAGVRVHVNPIDSDALRKALDDSEGKLAALIRDAHNPDPWKHRATGMRCLTCMWFLVKGGGERKMPASGHALGRCRRHAPTFHGFPAVFTDDWCGDHKLDETKVEP
jgi:hypothetical protein